MFDGKLPATLRQLHENWPAIAISLMTGNVQTLYEAVQTNQLDVAIIRAPLPALPDDLQSRPFTSEKTVLALPRQHPGHVIRADAFLREGRKWISLRDPQGMGLEQYFYDACNGAGFQPEVVQNATDVPTVISLVAAGFGIALLPASARAVNVGNVVYVDIIDRLRESDLTLVCHRIIRSEVLKIPHHRCSGLTPGGQQQLFAQPGVRRVLTVLGCQNMLMAIGCSGSGAGKYPAWWRTAATCVPVRCKSGQSPPPEAVPWHSFAWTSPRCADIPARPASGRQSR